jgi:magnesium-transporting ATPase (P-type)
MLIVLLIKYFVGFRNGVPSVTDILENLIRIIISTVTIVVVAVPEGLPLAVTLGKIFYFFFIYLFIFLRKKVLYIKLI